MQNTYWFYGSNKINISVAVAWSVESLPSNPATRVRFPAGSGILIPILGLGLWPLSVFCPYCLRRRPWHCADHTLRETHPCVSVYCSGPETVAPPTSIWPTGIWLVSPWGVSPRLGENKRRRRRRRIRRRKLIHMKGKYCTQKY